MAVRTFRLASPVVLDTACLSSLLWISRPDLLTALFGHEIALPEQARDELSNLSPGGYSWIPRLLEEQIDAGRYRLLRIPALGQIAGEFLALTEGAAGPPMGDGEAAALAYVRHTGGTVAGGDHERVREYCRTYGLELLGIGDLFCLAVARGIMPLDEAGELWERLRLRGRNLPRHDFTEVYRRFRSGKAGA